MYYYRLTKYDPMFRNENGHYNKDEWTEFGEVGIPIKGKILSLKEYESVEKKYIKSIQLFLSCVGLNELRCIQIEKHLDFREIPASFRELYDELNEDFVIEERMLPDILKMIMRNYVWCRLVSKKIMIHFSYNLYVFIRVQSPCKEAIEEVRSLGLFVEDFKNPWIDY